MNENEHKEKKGYTVAKSMRKLWEKNYWITIDRLLVELCRI